MRKIKFRHYDTRLQEMRFSEKNDGEFYINTKGVLYMYAIPKSESGLETEHYKSYSVEQFTGLYDNKNTGIYEGDIVIDHNGKGVVKYVESKAAYRVCYGYGYAKWFEDYTLRGERESIEVIGNVHENPELLGVGK